MSSAAKRWSPIVARAVASELTLGEFARREGVNANTLAWWKWKLGQPAHRSAFVSVVVKASARPSPPLAVRIGAALIDVDERTDLRLLRQVVEALS
jgi:hypothetical protein